MLAQARALAGATLAALAVELGVPLPAVAASAKGWAGELLERALGAAAGNDAEPDFPELGVELKTIPLRPDGRPAESTWVTLAALDPVGACLPWPQSAVGRKLGCVLWVPIEAAPTPLPDRRLGLAALWRPDAAELAVLERDYDDLMARVVLGDVERVDARFGDALQLRPKGRDASARVRAIGPEGRPVRAQGRGFYLRASFTHRVLNRCLAGQPPFPPPPLAASIEP